MLLKELAQFFFFFLGGGGGNYITIQARIVT